MKVNFCCPNCGILLKEEERIIKCDNCNQNYVKSKNYYDFSNKQKHSPNEKNSKIINLLKYVNQFEYKKGIKEFVKKFPNEKSYLINTKFDQTSDTIFHCLNKNYKNCLVIGNSYGNVVEILSNIFETVYSLEFSDECIEFQTKRFAENNITNVVCIKANLKDLPFDKNSFDIILIQNQFLYKEFEKYKLKIKESIYLKKIKTCLTDIGCLCLSLKNKHGLNLFSENKKSEKFSDLKTFSFQEYIQMFKKLDFKIKSYWGLPSEDRPYFSSKMDDEISLKWYFQNFTSFVKGTKIKIKQKIVFFVLMNIPGILRRFLIQNFTPFFIFCCYKNQINESIEDMILEKTKLKHCIIISRRIKINYIIFDNFGNPKFIVHCKRYGKDVPKDVQSHKRKFPKMENPEGRIWMEEWKNGRILNPYNHEEVVTAIKWLINFQKDTGDGFFKKDELFEENKIIRNVMEELEPINKDLYRKWLNEYELLIEKHDIKKSAVHGDFWYANMLYDSKQKSMNVVDWEFYKEKGNPFHDLTTFIMRLMIMSNSNEIEDFKFNLINNKKFKNTLQNIQKMINVHFNFPVDFNILLRYQILRNMVIITKDKQGKAFNRYLEMLKILENHRFEDYENMKILKKF